MHGLHNISFTTADLHTCKKKQNLYRTTGMERCKNEKIRRRLQQYDERGWSIDTGIPTKAKLKELGPEKYATGKEK